MISNFQWVNVFLSPAKNVQSQQLGNHLECSQLHITTERELKKTTRTPLYYMDED